MSITSSLSPPNREKRASSQILDIPPSNNETGLLSSRSSPTLFVRSPTTATWTSNDGINTASSVANTCLSSPTLGSSRRASTSAPEKMIFESYEDGVMNHNRRPFAGVNFCFRCDKRNTHRGMNALTQRVEKTGEKFRDSRMIPVYRNIFLCEECLIAVHQLKIENNGSTIVRITPLAMSFY